jgi:hypothetical protein
VNFGTKPVGSSTFKGATIKNTSSSTINLIVTVARAPDDFAFVTLTTCPVFEPAPLAPGESCDGVMRLSPSEFFAGQDAPVERAKIVMGAVAPASPDPIPIVLLPGFAYRMREWRHPDTHEVHWRLERRKSAQYGDNDE